MADKFLITELLEELKNDSSWCEDEQKRNELVNALTALLIQT